MVTLQLFLHKETKERITRFCNLLEQGFRDIKLEQGEGWFFYRGRSRIDISLKEYLSSVESFKNPTLIVGERHSNSQSRIRFIPSSRESLFMTHYLSDRFEVIESKFESAFHKRMYQYPSFSINLDPRM